MKWIAALVVCCLASTVALAQDGHKHDHGHGHNHGHDHGKKQEAKTGEMTQAEMMEAWMATAAPGPEHKYLEPMIGKWKTSAKHWMEPGQEPMISLGTCTNAWIMGGRYVQTDYQADFMGQPFKGMGMAGYDRNRKQFTNIWLDNMSTQPMIDTGSYDPSSKTFSYTGEFEMQGAKIKSKTTTKIISQDEHVMHMWHMAPGGKMEKVMELTFTRVKGES